jgi:hypothetical protein
MSQYEASAVSAALCRLTAVTVRTSGMAMYAAPLVVKYFVVVFCSAIWRIVARCSRDAAARMLELMRPAVYVPVVPSALR